ncbi:amidohydrolase [Streptomyces kutzneri]|uniref:amidohydrolase n=1 Tax=Streptomyces kutzneri TaxID=3051179 RepID=UPI0028D734B4|nr:amidohydrolase [Streptomyces sp. DSM 40907]
MPVGGITAVPGPSGRARNGKAAELVLRNAHIHTQDPSRPAATAIALRGGRITALGDDGDVARLVGPATRVVDALGRRVVPGLNDSHLHVIRGGLNYVLELRWDGVPSLRQALAMLREQAGRTPRGQWIRVVGGWTAEQFAERRMPTAAELTAAAPDTPVFVLHLYQSAVLNRAAVRAAGFTRHFLRELNRFGLTSAVDAAGGFQSFPENYATVTELARAGELSVRIGYHLFPQTAGQELADLARWTETVRPGDGDAWLRLNGAGENLTWAAADFENFSEPRPELGSYEGEFEKAVRLLMENGWGFRLHATYDETIGRDLAVFEKLAADGLFPAGNRWLFDHAETVSAGNLERIVALGGGISVQNRMSFQGTAFAQRYGSAAAALAPPVADMLRHDLPVAAGTDATRVSSYNPWVALHWLVTGRTVGGAALRPAGQLVSREQALELYTLGGARVTGEEEHKGVLGEDRFADFAVLSHDYFAVAADDIPHIESLLTVAGGRIVYAAGEYEGLDEALPPVGPGWSPVAHFGGYQATPPPSASGARQADLLAEAVAASEQHRRWRAARGFAPEEPPAVFDPCFGL